MLCTQAYEVLNLQYCLDVIAKLRTFSETTLTRAETQYLDLARQWF